MARRPLVHDRGASRPLWPRHDCRAASRAARAAGAIRAIPRRRACSSRISRSATAVRSNSASPGAGQPAGACRLGAGSDRLRRHQCAGQGASRRRMRESAPRAEAENLPPMCRQPARPHGRAGIPAAGKSRRRQRRRATNSAPVPLDATGAIAPRPIRKRIVEDDPFGPVGVLSRHVPREAGGRIRPAATTAIPASA